MARLKLIDLAAALGVRPAAVSYLKRKGMPTDSVEAAVAWRRVNVRPGRKERRPVGQLGEEIARLNAARAEIAEIEAAEKRGELIDVEEVRHVFSAAAVLFAGQLDGLPGRVANELAAMDDPALIRHKLRDETRRIRAAVAAEFHRLAFLTPRRPDGAAAKPDA